MLNILLIVLSLLPCSSCAMERPKPYSITNYLQILPREILAKLLEYHHLGNHSTAFHKELMDMQKEKNGGNFPVKKLGDTVSRTIAFSSDNNLIANALINNTIEIWDRKDEMCLKILAGHPEDVWSLCFNPTSELLASGAADNTIKIWRIKDGICLHTLQSPTDGDHSLAFSPENFLASRSRNTLAIWDIKTGKCLRQVPFARATALAYNAAGNVVISGYAGSYNKKILIAHMKFFPKKLVSVKSIIVDHEEGFVESTSFSPDGSMFVCGSAHRDTTTKVWDVETGALLKTLDDSDAQQKLDGSGCVRLVAFGPHGFIATAANDCMTRIWNKETETYIQKMPGILIPHYLALSPDAQIVASAGLRPNNEHHFYNTPAELWQLYDPTDKEKLLKIKSNQLLDSLI